jgi:hypothetical protein
VRASRSQNIDVHASDHWLITRTSDVGSAIARSLRARFNDFVGHRLVEFLELSRLRPGNSANGNECLNFPMVASYVTPDKSQKCARCHLIVCQIKLPLRQRMSTADACLFEYIQLYYRA